MKVTKSHSYLTGSYPLPPQGPHESSLFNPIQPPLKIPYLLMASMLYCEQVGVYLHELGKSGEILY